MTTSALDRLDQEVEGWKPEIADKIFGEVLTVDERPSDYGDPYPYLEIDDEISGKIIGVHAFHSVLKRDIARQKPVVGDKWGAKYLGQKQTKRTDSRGNTQPFENYNTLHEPVAKAAPPATDWKAMENDAEAELQDTGVSDADTEWTDEEEPF